MLSRSADGLYWMGRYLARSVHVCRLLQVQVELLVDRPIAEITFGWHRIYSAIGRTPPGGEFDPGESDDYTLADAFTLAGDLTFEDNHDSILGCLYMARENARQIRQCITEEMWTDLNTTYLRFRTLAIQDIWKVSPQKFYQDTAREVDAFRGIAETTMYRDQGWRFMQLGRFVEQAEHGIALLLAQVDLRDPEAVGFDHDWRTLLRVFQAGDAYDSCHGVRTRPGNVLHFLATDERLPGSLIHSLNTASTQFAQLGQGSDIQASNSAQKILNQLSAIIEYEWPVNDDHLPFLHQAKDRCRELHDLTMDAYVTYDAKNAPVR